MTTNIKDYSTTQANNTSLNSIAVGEGMLPSNLNNAIRALMKNTRDWFNDAQWIEFGDGDASYTATYVSATSFKIAGANVTSDYHAGRRIKITASTPGTIFGTISSSSFSTDTTVVVSFDSGTLSNEAISNVYLAALTKTNTSIPEGVIATATLADGSVTTAKLAADAVNGTKIADDSINSEHYVDGSIDTAHIADSQITTAKIGADAVDGTKIADDSINSEHYVDGSIDTAHIADSQITTAKIADTNVTTAKIADSAITSAKINDGAIVDADINASAAIDASKIHDGTISNTEFGHLNGVTSNIQSQLDAREASNANLTAIGSLANTDGNFIVGSGSTWVAESGSTARVSLGLGTIATQSSSSVSISGGSITGLGAPSNSSDAATKNYVDNLVTGLKTRIITRTATTANIDLSADLQNGDSLDGITLATGNKVLVKDQTDATQNGIYDVVASGTATRNTDYDTVAELAGQLVIVQEGSSNADKIFLCTTDNSGSIGSVNIVFTIVQPSNVGDVTLTGTQTLTNKTLTSPVISEIVSVSNGNISVLPNGTGKVLLDGNGSTGGVTISDGNIDIRTGTGAVSKVKFYCESSNAHAQTLQAQPHSAGSSAVLTLPVATGTLIASGDTGTLPLAAIDVDGGTDIGADLTTSDLIIVDDGAGGTNRKAALSRLVTFIDANSSAASKGFATAMSIAL
tara:strand:+ start:826 stop:2901 length:2076 start_codon:yes stop_codon:yes gene_type:complete